MATSGTSFPERQQTNRLFWVQKAITESRNSEQVYREATLWAATYLLVLTETGKETSFIQRNCIHVPAPLVFLFIPSQNKCVFASGGKESNTLAKSLLLNTGLYINIPFLKTNIILFLVPMHASSYLVACYSKFSSGNPQDWNIFKLLTAQLKIS